MKVCPAQWSFAPSHSLTQFFFCCHQAKTYFPASLHLSFIVFQKMLFKKFFWGGTKMTHSDSHSLCLLNLGKGCRQCFQFRLKVKSNRAAQVKADLWGKALLPPESLTAKSSNSKPPTMANQLSCPPSIILFPSDLSMTQSGIILN